MIARARTLQRQYARDRPPGLCARRPASRFSIGLKLGVGRRTRRPRMHWASISVRAADARRAWCARGRAWSAKPPPGSGSCGHNPQFNSNYKSAGNGSGSFQDISVLTLSAAGKDEAVSMTVGFRPRDVFFADDSKHAYVVTEDGVSVLDFAAIEKDGSDIAPLFSFGGGIDQKTLDVAVTPDGHYALARAEGKSVLRLVDLRTGKVRTLDVANAYEPPADTEDDAGAPVIAAGGNHRPRPDARRCRRHRGAAQPAGAGGAAAAGRVRGREQGRDPPRARRDRRFGHGLTGRRRHGPALHHRGRTWSACRSWTSRATRLHAPSTFARASRR